MNSLFDVHAYVYGFWLIEDGANEATAVDSAVSFLTPFLESVRISLSADLRDTDRRAIAGSGKITLHPYLLDPHWQQHKEKPGIESESWIFRVHDVMGAMGAVRKIAEVSLEGLRSLESMVRLTGSGGDGWLGGAICLAAGVSDGSRRRQLATEIFQSGVSHPYCEVRTQPGSDGLSLFKKRESGTEFEDLLLLYPRSGACDAQASDWLNEKIPDIARCSFKLRFLKSQYEVLLKTAREISNEVDTIGALDAASSEGARNSQRMTGDYQKLAVLISRLHTVRQSVQINRNTVSSISSSIGNTVPGWFSDLASAADRFLLQVDADLSYLDIKMREIAIAIEASSAAASYYRAEVQKQETQALNFLNFLIAIVGIGLAMLQVLDAGSTKSILNYFGIFSLRDSDQDNIVIFAVRLGIGVFASVLAALAFDKLRTFALSKMNSNISLEAHD